MRNKTDIEIKTPFEKDSLIGQTQLKAMHEDSITFSSFDTNFSSTEFEHFDIVGSEEFLMVRRNHS